MIKSNTNQTLSAENLLGKIVLSVSLKDFSVRTMEEFKPDIFLNDGDNVSNYGINAKVIALPGHTDGSIGLDVDNSHLIVGDALMNMFYPTVSMLFHNKNDMLESAIKISRADKSINRKAWQSVGNSWIAIFCGKMGVYVVIYRGKDKNTTQGNLAELVGSPVAPFGCK